MTAVQLLADLYGRGVELQATADRLRWRPIEALTDADRQALTEHKAELLTLLAGAVQASVLPSGQVSGPITEPVTAFHRSGRPVRIVQRQGGLVHIEGVLGWLDADAIGQPCGTCGGTRFAIGHWRLFCPACLRPNRGERVRGYLDVTRVTADQTSCD